MNGGATAATRAVNTAKAAVRTAQAAAAAASAAPKKTWQRKHTDGKIYGVRFASDGTATRTGAAVGMTAEASTDTYAGRNDFDHVPIFDFTRVNGYVTEDGEFVETAVKGDLNFALDGSNGDVYSRFKTSFYREMTTDTYCELQLTDRPTAYNVDTLGAWRPFSIFIRPDGSLRPYAYIAAYEAAFNNADGKLASISGAKLARSSWGNRNLNYHNKGFSYDLHLSEIRKKGTQYCGITAKEIFFLCALFSVEFATLDSQSIMTGAVDMAYSYRCSFDRETNKFILSSYNASHFAEGCTVSLGTGSMSSINNANLHSIDENVKVLKIEQLDSSNAALTIETEHEIPVDSDIAISIMPWNTGATDTVLGSSGSLSSNSDRKHPMMYRGIENLYGNAWAIVSDVIISENIPYTCYDCAYFSSNIQDEAYYSLNYTTAATTAPVKKLGKDARHPFLRLPIETDLTQSMIPDYYYTSSGADMQMLYGGFTRNKEETGIWCFNGRNSLNAASWDIGARISACGRCGVAPSM